ncbi:MAG: hypothetical protein AAGM38_10545, partial [Pseudomonadota bacterium]
MSTDATPDIGDVLGRQRSVADHLAMIALQELWARMPWDAEIHLPGGAVAKLKPLSAPKTRRFEDENGSAMPPRFGFDLIIPRGSGFDIDHIEFFVQMT